MTADTLSFWLHTHGLSLCAFRGVDLPDDIATMVATAAPVPELLATSQLLLLANVGPRFWRRLQTYPHRTNHNPVDDYSLDLVAELQRRFLRNTNRAVTDEIDATLGDDTVAVDTNFVQLYPTPANQDHIPLMRLGALAGWNVPSPLGLGLHPEYGPWSAYRAAWLTQSTRLPETYRIKPGEFASPGLNALQNSASLCLGCDAPCASACPADAIHLGRDINLERCYAHRVPETSDCHIDCAARKACPIGADHHYDDDQLAHHMSMTWRR